MSSFPNLIASEKRNRPHVLVAGAGLGGLTLAIRLTELGFPATVLEARSEESATSEGVFLTLAPNGMNGLRTAGCYDAARAAGIETLGIEIRNGSGRLLGFADQRDHEPAFGAPSVTLGRGVLTRLLLERARAVGATIRFGTRIAGLSEGGSIEVVLADGSRVGGDLLVGADGLRSTVRTLAFQAYPAPVFTGLIGTGGLTEAPVSPTGGEMRMTFGNNAFFGNIKGDSGPAFWFNSYAADASEIGVIADPAAYARRIEALHATDPEPNRTILAHVRSLSRNYPVYDVPPLPGWSRGRVVLLGDAAHAVGPHAGQGASMAIEDAVVLAACLDAAADEPSDAFGRFEALRRARVAEVVRLTHSNGSQKRTSSLVGLFVRDLVLPFLIPMGIKAGRRFFHDRVDLDPLMARAA